MIFDHIFFLLYILKHQSHYEELLKSQTFLKTKLKTIAQNFGIEGANADDYPSNVLAVYMTLKSDQYGQFDICRYVKVYSAPESGWNMTEAGD